jgi:acyl carrier protein
MLVKLHDVQLFNLINQMTGRLSNQQPLNRHLDSVTKPVTIARSTKSPFLEAYPMSSTLEDITEIIVELLGVEPEDVKPESRFREELDADSLDLVELIMAFEEKFGAEISDEDAQTITTVGEAVAYIDSHSEDAE